MNSPGPNLKPPQNDASPGHSQSGSPPASPCSDTSPPPLPPRPEQSVLLTPTGSSRKTRLQGNPTTALSLSDGVTVAHAPPAVRSNANSKAASRRSSMSYFPRPGTVDLAAADDNASIQSILSHAPVGQGIGDPESFVGELPVCSNETEWPNAILPASATLRGLLLEDIQFASEFEEEFREPQESHNFKAEEDVRRGEAQHPTEVVERGWSKKLKNFLIISSAGKPIYSRHGDDNLISNPVGVMQTIISYYQEAEDTLKAFKAGNAHFIVLSKGHLYLVAVSRLDESVSQLRTQLEALYMQILSTLTLPSMEKMFLHRASTDLRRPLQGTETLLSALADGFTRGSPSTLLSSLECLRLCEAHRQVINNTFVRCRASTLLYGLIVAGGRLVSVLRPKKHSLHPGDLQIIFNMLFEAKSLRSGGGESWVPLCLPGFNNTGYVYMYVSFLHSEQHSGRTAGVSSDAADASIPHHGDSDEKQDYTGSEIAFILISTSKEAFDDLRSMRDKLVNSLTDNKALIVIKNAASRPRQSCSEILPGTPLRHFLYKSRPHVQFTMPNAGPDFKSPIAWRQLISRYANLHAEMHGRPGNIKLQYSIDRDRIALGWVSSDSELYAVAASGAIKHAVAQGAAKIIRWVKAEEHRLFIVGGAVRTMPLFYIITRCSTYALSSSFSLSSFSADQQQVF